MQNKRVQESDQQPKKDGRDEGYWFAFALGIGLTIFWGPLLGFYAGTVIGNKTHYWDLRNVDMINGEKGAAIGAIVGLLALIYILVVYPTRTKKDIEDWSEEYSHPHFDKHH